MSSFSIKEFRPTIIFLTKFIGLYLVGNLAYGIYITSFAPGPDPITHLVSVHTAKVLSVFGWPVSILDRTTRATTWLVLEGKSVLSIYEGCNGVNTLIIFLSFLLAFGPLNKKIVWFIPAGILIIHLTNLARIGLLFAVAVHMPRYMYFTHKYLFTAIIYGVVFILWILWVKMNSAARRNAEQGTV